MYLILLGLLCLQPHNPTAFNILGLVGHMLFIKHVIERESSVLKPCKKAYLGRRERRDATGQIAASQKRSYLHLSQ